MTDLTKIEIWPMPNSLRWPWQVYLGGEMLAGYDRRGAAGLYVFGWNQCLIGVDKIPWQGIRRTGYLQCRSRLHPCNDENDPYGRTTDGGDGVF
jgi:hypothetical protein